MSLAGLIADSSLLPMITAQIDLTKNINNVLRVNAINIESSLAQKTLNQPVSYDKNSPEVINFENEMRELSKVLSTIRMAVNNGDFRISSLEKMEQRLRNDIGQGLQTLFKPLGSPGQ